MATINYTIQRGDTLSGIARRHGTTVSAIMALNPQIRDPNVIFANAIIRVPGTAPVQMPAPIPRDPPLTATPAPAPPAATINYTIRRGDTLSGIARRHGTTVSAIMALNPQIRDPNVIIANAVIRVPGRATTLPIPQQPQEPGWVPGMLPGIIRTPLGDPIPEGWVPPGIGNRRNQDQNLVPPGFAEDLLQAPGRALEGIQNFLENLGWSPRMAKIAMWAVFITALAKLFQLRVRV